MLDNLFSNSLFTIKCTYKNKIKAILLANTCATRYGFIDKKFIKKVCQILKIKP